MLKYCAVLSLCAGLGLASDYMTYQAARLVIGQPTFTNQQSGATNQLLGSAAGIAFAANTLFVADSNRFGLTPDNNRVLLFGNITQSMPQPLDAIPNFSGRCPVCLGKATTVLGQPDFTSSNFNTSATGLRTPTAVASDGQILAVADTANNRVLIWNTIPTTNGKPADLVLGQPDFNTVQPVVVNSSTFRAPQGVWIQNGKLFVADTQNSRVMIWNSIPTKNNQAADVVLGQPSFTSAPVLDLTQNNLTAAPNTMLNPISVTSDGVRLFVTDLGFNRVLIWKSIPTQTQQPADVEIGQPDMVSSIPNYAFSGAAATTSGSTNVETPVLCTVATGTDSNGAPTYPQSCAATLSFPRFALSDGTRLYIADGGNDRVLVFNTIPTQNAASADVVLGQPDAFSDVVTSSNNSLDNPLAPNLQQSGANVIPSPTSLAWDGANLYVSDPTDFRILVFTPAAANIPANGVRNAASLEIFATDAIILGGAINGNDTATVTICPPVNGAAFSAATCSNTATGAVNYTYTVQKTDTFDLVSQGLAALINAGSGDPYVFAKPELGQQTLLLVARQGGAAGNIVEVAASVSSSAQITATATSAFLTGGNDPTTIAPGTLISIQGTNLADQPVAAPANAQTLPFQLGGVTVYCDGIGLPLIYVSPTQINAQLPFELIDTNSSSCYVRIQHADGSVSITDAVGIPIDLQNPGIFAAGGSDPRPAIAFHASSYATGLISVDGSIVAGNTATATIGSHSYTYTVLSTDTLASIRDQLVAQINANGEELVNASASPSFTRIFLQAKVPGPEGNNIVIGGTSGVSGSATVGTPSAVTITATTPTLCCANRAGSPVTPDNPALAGEVIYIYATGLGLVQPDQAKNSIVDGTAYQGPISNTPNASVSSLAGTVTAQVISAGLAVGMIGVYEVVLQLGSGAANNPNSQLTISQDIYTSNIVTIPIYNPNPPSAAQ
jgi:uncharacterized protein (TIGR03437 family)